MTHHFNLADVGWIRVINRENIVSELSLTDVLLNAHLYSGLAGESPAQNAALLRLLIAAAHTIFYRADENGAYAPLLDTDDALDRW